MTTKYQLVMIGALSSWRQEILDAFFRRTGELGIEPAKIKMLDAAGFSAYEATAPTFVLYFGDASGHFANLDILYRLQRDAKLVLPVVDDLKNFIPQMPAALHQINGFALDNSLKIEPLVGIILEGLNLLRLTRRLFISYKRDESRSVAVQLFEELEAAGFNVFLDTHSIRPAQPFQSELWHQMVDTDVVVLLNTPRFLESEWTTKELARANAMAVGVVQLNWPGFKVRPDAELSLELQLEHTDFGNPLYATPEGYLSTETIKRIISGVESLRARCLAARQFNIIKEFISVVSKTDAAITIEPAKYLIVTKKNGELLLFIPTIGIPQAFSYYQADQIAKKISAGNVVGVYLLYDHLYIRKEWLAHLAWLDKSFDRSLRLKTMRTREAKTIIPTLI